MSDRQAKGACDADFFDSHNKQAAALREQVAAMALQDMLNWLDQEDDEEDYYMDDDVSRHNGSVSSGIGSGVEAKLSFKRYERIAIFDATNSTNARRQWVLEQCTSPLLRPVKPTGVVFVESICDDNELLEENYRYKIKNSPDFAGMSADEAIADLRRRVQKYEDQYETITDDSHSYIKIFNLSTKLMVNHIYGRMAKELVPALMSWHIGTRPIFLCRPGETVTGVTTDGEDYVARTKLNMKDPKFLDMSSRTRRKTMRGDTLGPKGLKFREELLSYTFDEVHAFLFRRASVQDMAYTGTSISGLDNPSMSYSGDVADSGAFPMKVFTSTMPRAVDTVNWEDYDFAVQQNSNLNPLDKGDFAGMEMDEIRETDPQWYEKLQKDAYGTRFPGGESYRDLIRRLTSVTIDLEQQVIPTLVVSHVSILQCLMAYFRNTPVEQCTAIEVPMHTVIKFTPVRGGGWSESHHSLHESNENGMMIPVEADQDFSVSTLAGDDPPIWQDGMPIQVPSAQSLTQLAQPSPPAAAKPKPFAFLRRAHT